MRKYPTASECPPASSEKWARWASPLRDFLSIPRTWPELETWAKDHDMSGMFLRNCLAWLSSMELAEGFPTSSNGSGHGWVWVATVPAPPEEEIEKAAPTQCHRCGGRLRGANEDYRCMLCARVP